MFPPVACRCFKPLLLKLLWKERNSRRIGKDRREKKRKGNPRGTKPGEKDKNLANGGTHPLNYNGHVVVALQCFPWSVRGKREEAYHKLPCVAEGLVTSVQSIFHAFVRFCRALF